MALGSHLPRRRPRLVIVDQFTWHQPLRELENFAYYQRFAAHCERVDLYCSATDDVGYEAVYGKLYVHALPGWRGSSGSLRFTARVGQLIRLLERQVHPDIYLIRDSLTVGLLGWWGSLLSRAPWVIEVRNDYLNPWSSKLTQWSPVKRWLMAALTGFWCRRASRVRAVSPAIVEDLVRVRVPRERILLYPSPIDTDLFDPARYVEHRAELRAAWGWQDAVVVAFAGALVPGKGVDILLRALALANRPNLRLMLLGNGELLEALQAQAAELGIQDQVRFCGYVPHATMPEHLAAADAFALPSRSEGLPRAANEAGALALPVVLSSVSGNSNVVLHDQTGWVVDLTPEAFAERLAQLADMTSEQRAGMGQAARQWIVRQYSLAASESMIHDMLLAPYQESQR